MRAAINICSYGDNIGQLLVAAGGNYCAETSKQPASDGDKGTVGREATSLEMIANELGGEVVLQFLSYLRCQPKPLFSDPVMAAAALEF